MPLINTFGAASARGFGFATGVTKKLVISADTANYNIFTSAGSPTYPVAVTLTINASINVYSTSTATYALDTGTGWATGSTITIANSGKIIGKGGAGGNGAYWVASVNYAGPTVGAGGGPALRLQYATTISGSGFIVGGGGGGGGGGGNILPGYILGYGGNGGGGGYNGGGGSNGFTASGGTGTFVGGGLGSVGNPSSGTAAGGAGGDGGYGTTGATGASGTGSSGYDFPGLGGGIAGNAINGLANIVGVNPNTVIGTSV